jgi:hypothetical protein
MRLRFLILVVMIALGQGCKEDSITPYDYASISNCHNKSSWGLESMEDKIVGLWEWKYIKCCGYTNSPYENDTEFKGLKIEFRDDGTGTLTDDGGTEEFTWSIGAYNGLYSFSTEPGISQISGYLSFCDDIMMCSTSYFDGPDNFFKKLD